MGRRSGRIVTLMLAMILVLSVAVQGVNTTYYVPANVLEYQSYFHYNRFYQAIIEEKNKQQQSTQEPIQQEDPTITISAAGDVTLGYYYGQNEWNRFDKVSEKEGMAYFFKNVAPIFKADDLTIVNLEGPLTTGGQRVDKKFAMKGEPSYTQILLDGDVEAVSLANNHTYDYGTEGYKQTKEALTNAGIGYFGEDGNHYMEVNGIKVALIGAKGWDNSKGTKEKLRQSLEAAKEKADLSIVMFHWGIEREFYPNKVQQDLGYYAIDQGADLVLGSHPHVVQGIEKYKGKSIIYSLGNFAFGGNRNPDDKDSFIYQETFKLTKDGIQSVASKVIPCRISSTTSSNNYQPTPLVGEDAEKVMNRIIKYSSQFNESYFK
ncbi:MAG: CapA family protein [Cellulosilyticaceae bacterium]